MYYIISIWISCVWHGRHIAARHEHNSYVAKFSRIWLHWQLVCYRCIYSSQHPSSQRYHNWPLSAITIHIKWDLVDSLLPNYFVKIPMEWNLKKILLKVFALVTSDLLNSLYNDFLWLNGIDGLILRKAHGRNGHRRRCHINLRNALESDAKVKCLRALLSYHVNMLIAISSYLLHQSVQHTIWGQFSVRLSYLQNWRGFYNNGVMT